MKILVIDNYDSFTFNLVQYMGELGASIDVIRNDEVSIEEVVERGFDQVVVSPGPGRPENAGISMSAMRQLPELGIPTLGVCLGHQALVQVYGGTVGINSPVHGKTSVINHNGRGLFLDLPNPLTVGRYHSLVATGEIPEELEVTATGDQVIMAVQHRHYPAFGVQFHPESILTEHGPEILANFFKCGK